MGMVFAKNSFEQLQKHLPERVNNIQLELLALAQQF